MGDPAGTPLKPAPRSSRRRSRSRRTTAVGDEEATKPGLRCLLQARCHINQPSGQELIHDDAVLGGILVRVAARRCDHFWIG
eukprot:15468872-Alexandrium_andersonii.AAC.1